MTLINCLVKDLTPFQYGCVYSLNLRKRGFSRGHLRNCFHQRHQHSRIAMIWDGPRLLGWCLMVQCLDESGKLTEYSTNLYVRRDMRKKGVGRRLFRWLGRYLDSHNEKAHVCIWSPASEGFYQVCTHSRVRVIVSPRYQLKS